jgi:hypothetical protein
VICFPVDGDVASLSDHSEHHLEEVAMRVTVLGTGWMGTVTATCLAQLGHGVVALDVDPLRAEQLGTGKVTFFEPGLRELVRGSLAAGGLTSDTDPEDALPDAGFVFLCVGTPQAADGLLDLSQVETALGARDRRWARHPRLLHLRRGRARCRAHRVGAQRGRRCPSGTSWRGLHPREEPARRWPTPAASSGMRDFSPSSTLLVDQAASLSESRP